MAEKFEQEGPLGEVLHRDNSRFKFFYDNGKPVLPKNLRITLAPITTFQLAHDLECLSK